MGKSRSYFSIDRRSAKPKRCSPSRRVSYPLLLQVEIAPQSYFLQTDELEDYRCGGRRPPLFRKPDRPRPQRQQSQTRAAQKPEGPPRSELILQSNRRDPAPASWQFSQSRSAKSLLQQIKPL